MSAFQHLRQLEYMIPESGDGIRRRLALPLNSLTRANGAPIGASTGSPAFGFATVETNGLAIQWAATNVVEVALLMNVPMDYDEQEDELKILLHAQMGGATNTPAFEADAYRKTPGGDLSADLDPANSAALSDDSSVVEIDLSGNGLQAGDALQVFINPEAHGTDALNLYHLEALYRSMLVLAKHVDRT